MSLALALNTALTGINISQQSLAVLSQNIANVNTPGYSRKIIQQGAQSIDGTGVGVRIEDITRRVDQYLQRSVQLQTSVAGYAITIDNYADRTQLLLGNPGSSNSINAYTTNFFNNLESLSQTPEDSVLKTLSVNSAVTLARRVSGLAEQLQSLRYEADHDISDATTIINSALSQIYGLNKTITANQQLGKPATELEDQRDTLVAQISEYFDVQTIVRSNGAVNLAVNGISLLDDSLYQLTYSPLASIAALSDNAELSPILLTRVNDNGELVGQSVQLSTGGTSDTVVSSFTTGKFKAWLDMRDKQIPQMLSQLDLYASTLRDQVNAVHNAGTSFPGAHSYTGTRAVFADAFSQWSGKVRIGVLDSAGHPIGSPYYNQTNGYPPLTIDLASLSDGNGTGYPSMQTIINEINQYYGAPQNKVQVGNLSNIRLASNSSSLPGSPARFNFDLDLENLSANGSKVFVTGVTVLDDTATDITSITQNVPTLAINPTTGFSTTSGESTVTITTTSAHGLQEGDRIYLPDIAAAINPATDLNGIPLSELSDQFFTISNVTATSFQISAMSDAGSSGAVASTGAVIMPPYAEVDAGETRRTTSDGTLTADLSLNSTSSYYTVTVDVTVEDGNGILSTSQVTYRVDNSQSNLLNTRYAPRSVAGQGTLVQPTTSQYIARAILVDANGVELPKTNGRYITEQAGYLKIITREGSTVLAIDSLDSVEGGQPEGVPLVEATGRAFSHYFGLNNFFSDANADDPLTNSALSLAVEQRLIANPGLLATGLLTLSASGSGYTYERTIGDQSIAQRLSALGLANVTFSATGGLAASSQTFASYAGQIISAAASKASAASNESDNAKLLLDSFTQQSSSISGVNLDEELANTVIYQNSYTASARIISVTKDLFDALIGVF